MPYLVVSDGTKIYYEDRGSGEPILFLHGVCASHLAIGSFINEFKGQYRCICMDFRGHGASNHLGIHMNVQTLAQDVHELLEYLDLTDVTVIGHSLGAFTTYDYIRQFGCERLKRFVAVDIGPCANNHDWKGGLGRGEWTDADFLEDMDRYFNDPKDGNWTVAKELMMPALKQLPPEAVPGMRLLMTQVSCDTFTVAGLWYSVFRTDNRPVIEKITIPFMYIFPETPICNSIATDFIRDNIKSPFVLADGFPGTTHAILMEAPKAAADRVKEFLANY